MTATTRLLLEAAHGTTDPEVLSAKAKTSGTVTTEQVRKIAEAKLPDLKTADLDCAVTLVTTAAQQLNLQVR